MSNALLLLSVCILIIVGIIWTSIKSREFEKEKVNLQTAYVESQKQLIMTEVKRAVSYIKYRRSFSVEQMKNQLKVRVDGAWQVANNIYLENRDRKSSAEIQQMIKNAIRPLRFANDRGDVFIYSLDGVSVMLPRSRHSENTASIQHRDNYGNYVVQNEVNLLSMLNNGFIDYHIPNQYKPGDSVLLKSTYVRKFEPFGWYFGSKDYLEDYDQDLRGEILDWLAQVRYGEDGYIFVNTSKGRALVYDGRKMLEPTDIYNSRKPEWIEAYRLQQKVYNTTREGYIQYEFSLLASDNKEVKTSYISSLQDWGWIVGAGFYNSTVSPNIALVELQYKYIKRQTFAFVVLTLVLILVFLFLLSKWFSHRLINGFSNFNQHFRNASLTGGEMDTANFNSLEFKELASAFNVVSVELNQARKQLIKEQSLLRSLIDSSPDLIFFKDAESNFVGCNKAFSDYIGIPEAELIGKNDAHFFPEELAQEYNLSDSNLLKSGVPIRNEQWIVKSDGSKHLMDTVKVLNRDKDNNIIGILGISRDITDREIIQQKYIKAKEKAEEADRLKTSFLANMSHEIRTPLNSIIGFSGLLSEAEVSEEDKAEFIRHINQGSESLLNLIDDIIDIAKIEAGQLVVTIEKCDIKSMLEELSANTTELIRKRKKTDLRLTFSNTLPASAQFVYTDPFRLKQVISNLLVNAVKFTDKGEILFGVYEQQGSLHFYVKDTGIGISADRQNIIFERFMQEHKSGARHQGGTGLGLAISKHIVELLGGSIHLKSVPDEGSEFSFSIPFSPVISIDHQDKIIHENIPITQNWENKTMLVVEDVDSNYNYIHAALSRTGINLLRARDGKEGTSLCRDYKDIDIVLMDIGIPSGDGLEATRVIKKLRPDLPVIAQTSYSRQSGFTDAGFDDTIPKPVKLAQLINVMSQWIK